LNRELISHYYYHWFPSGYQETRTTRCSQTWYFILYHPCELPSSGTF